MNWILYGLAALAAIYIVFVAAPAILMYFLIFVRKTSVPLDRRDLSQAGFAAYATEILDYIRQFDTIPFQRVSTTAHDGIELVGDYHAGSNGRVVIFFHGYGASGRNNFFCQATQLCQQGYHVVLVCQRGHDESGGKQVLFGLEERYDVDAWITWAQQNVPEARVLLYGTSMGAATVAYASANQRRERVCGMVLDCGFLSPSDALEREYVKRSLPYGLLAPYINFMMKLFHDFDIREKTTQSLAKSEIPALFLCGTADETVSTDRVRQAYDSCAAEKELIEVSGAAHTLAYLVGGEEVQARVAAFAERCFTN